jgi:hypothetical protein
MKCAFPAALIATLAGACTALAQVGGTFDLTWNTYDCGGGTSTGGGYTLIGTIGQPDAGSLANAGLVCAGGFWGGAVTCYANCDNSTVSPILNVGDFTCFLQRFAAADPYANCDGSTVNPILNVGDFTCFLQRFAAGCP